VSPGESGYQVADSNATRSRRKRQHAAGDHSLCLPARCPALGAPPRDVARDTSGLAAAVEEEFAGPDPLSRALARRLVELASGPGVGGVQAVHALAEMVAAQREGSR
jgi:hypothetical protein